MSSIIISRGIVPKTLAALNFINLIYLGVGKDEQFTNLPIYNTSTNTFRNANTLSY